MQKTVESLKEIIPFKDTTEEGDIVLVVCKNPDMLYYAYIEEIERDVSRRDEWWHVHMQLLTIPLQKAVWTLRTPQMTGMEIFTMGGEERFVKAIEVGKADLPEPVPEEKKKGKVVPFKLVK